MIGKTNAVSIISSNVYLGTKTINELGTYSASDEDLDGYSSVTVEPTVRLCTPSFTIECNLLYLNTGNGDFPVSVQFYIDNTHIGTFSTDDLLPYLDLADYLDDYNEHTLEVWLENPEFIRSYSYIYMYTLE